MSDKLKIGYFADGKWAHDAFEMLINDETIEIKFICPRNDTKDETLKRFSEKYNIDYIMSENINSQKFIETVKAYNCDLLVSMSFNQIFKKEIINITRLKTINCHAGKLPFYRGRNILNWVLINDEKEFGITVHYVDEGIDTGDIISQETYPITDDDDYGSLLQTAYKECPKILYNSIKKLQKGEVNRIQQSIIHPIGFYCGMRKEGDEFLDWNQDSRVIFNFVRAISKPGPMARSYIDGKLIKINKVAMIKGAINYIGIPGQVVGKHSDRLIVKTKDSMIELLEYEYDGNIKIGDRLSYQNIKRRWEI